MNTHSEDRDPVEALAEEFVERNRRGEHPDTARNLAAMGVLRYVQGNYDAAIPLLREAKNIAEKTLGIRPP